MQIKSVAVLGAGAVGSYVIWGLSSRKDIRLAVIAEGPRAERLKQQGITINGTTYRPQVWTPQEANGVDLLVVALKYGALPGALDSIAAAVGPNTTVMSLMNGARVAISGQALGIAEAAYREARKYAAERVQFKQSIDQFPAIYEMLAKMKIKVTAARTLLYETTRMVDLRYSYMALDERSEKAKYYSKVAAALTPMCKALSTEIANQVAYDCIQIHGGTGYMHDFDAERYYRDARITNIYEGTTQLQVVAAIGGIMQRVLDPMITELLGVSCEGLDCRLLKMVEEMFEKQKAAVQFVAEKKDSAYHDLRARNLVENETIVVVSLLMLRDAKKDPKRVPLAERYILDAVHDFERNYQIVMSGDLSTIDRHRDVIDY